MAIELGELLRGKLQTARDRVLVSILHHAVDVLLGAAWDGSALANANVDDETALVLLLEESGNSFLLVDNCGRHWCNPDGAIYVLLCKQVYSLEVVHVDLAGQIGSCDALVKLDLVEL